MKRLAILLLVLSVLTGCSGKTDELNRAMELRTKMLASGVQFDAEITADYGDKVYTFGMQCQSDSQGNMTFSVTEPEVIRGITGKISSAGGELTFDDAVLAFEWMADGQLTPVSAPWILINTLRSGYLTSAVSEGDLFRVAIDDSYADDALHMDIWLDADNLPVRGEVLWQGRRLLTIVVRNFTFL